MKFLVTASNGDVGEAIGRILKERWPAAQLHGSDIGGAWPGQATFDSMHRLPPGGDPGYVSALVALAAEVGASAVFPVSEPELLSLSSSSNIIKNVPIVMLPGQLVARFCDKLETARWLQRHGLPAPRTVPLAEAAKADLPIIVKSIHGHGGYGYDIVRSVEHLTIVQSTKSDGYVAQALLEPDDQEYTCALVRLDKEVRALVMRRRLDGSNTVLIEVVSNPEIERMLRQLAEAADLDGSINVQLRLTRQGPQIFEINPRFSGTVMMRHRLGFQDLLWVLAAREGRPPPRYAAPIGARVFRMAREVVVPADVVPDRNCGAD